MEVIIRDPEMEQVYQPTHENQNYDSALVIKPKNNKKQVQIIDAEEKLQKYDLALKLKPDDSNNEEYNLNQELILNETMDKLKPQQQLVIYKKQLHLCHKLIASNAILQRRLQLVVGFMQLDSLKKEKPKGLLQKIFDKVRNKKVTVKTIKNSGYNMSDTTLRNDLDVLCHLGIIEKTSAINENGRRVQDYRLRA